MKAVYPEESKCFHRTIYFMRGVDRMTKRKRIKAETFDVVQYFYGKVHEPLIHCMISLAGHVDEAILKQAVDLSFAAIPLLGYCFVDAGRSPYWEERDFTAHDIVRVITAGSDPEAQKQKLLSMVIDPVREPQLKIYILREQDRDILCLIINHMICDGAGFKEYLYLLGGLYTCCLKETGIRPKLEAARRDARQLMTRFSFREKLRIWSCSDYLPASGSQPLFPLQGDAERPFFAAVSMGEEDFASLKTYAKQWGATVNDMIMAAYIRALGRKLGTDHIVVPCPVDLRKYLPADRKYRITNLTSNFICNVQLEPEDSFEQTVRKVAAQMKLQKESVQCLKDVMVLDLLYRLLPFDTFQGLFRRIFTIPVISFTNLGVIDQDLLRFGELEIKDVYLTGAVKYVPYFQIAVSTYNDRCTFSSNLYGTRKDRTVVEQFLSELKEELCLGLSV
jgi:NRPS condensation-like uncharacterized protein